MNFEYWWLFASLFFCAFQFWMYERCRCENLRHELETLKAQRWDLLAANSMLRDKIDKRDKFTCYTGEYVDENQEGK